VKVVPAEIVTPISSSLVETLLWIVPLPARVPPSIVPLLRKSPPGDVTVTVPSGVRVPLLTVTLPASVNAPATFALPIFHVPATPTVVATVTSEP